MELVSACLGFQPHSLVLFNQEADVSSLTGGCLVPVLPILGHIPQKADFSTPSTLSMTNSRSCSFPVIGLKVGSHSLGLS